MTPICLIEARYFFKSVIVILMNGLLPIIAFTRCYNDNKSICKYDLTYTQCGL